MSIQPAPMGQRYKYRINIYNGRTIEKKPNRRGGRWEVHQVCANEQSARRILLKLQNDTDEDE